MIAGEGPPVELAQQRSRTYGTAAVLRAALDAAPQADRGEPGPDVVYLDVDGKAWRPLSVLLDPRGKRWTTAAAFGEWLGFSGRRAVHTLLARVEARYPALLADHRGVLSVMTPGRAQLCLVLDEVAWITLAQLADTPLAREAQARVFAGWLRDEGVARRPVTTPGEALAVGHAVFRRARRDLKSLEAVMTGEGKALMRDLVALQGEGKQLIEVAAGGSVAAVARAYRKPLGLDPPKAPQKPRKPKKRGTA